MYENTTNKMATVLIVDKSGKITETKLKQFSIEEICKKAKVKNVDDYKRMHVWSIMQNKSQYHIALYARAKGRAGQENKYDFPPPADTQLYFGNCMLVNQKDPTNMNDVSDLTEDVWNNIYEELFGGFDDCLESEDEDSEEDMDGMEMTKDGYALDDFVVDDDEEDEDNDYNTEEEEEEEIIKPKKKKTTRKATTSTKSKAKSKGKEPVVEDYLGCDSELEEEAYF